MHPSGRYIKDACVPAASGHPAGCGGCAPSVNNAGWTVPTNQCLINDACYADNTKDAVGCRLCDAATSKTSWTKVPGCYKIVLTTLNEGHQGDLGGVTGADALCAKQAMQSGWTGTFKAFLSDSTRNVKDLITGTNALKVQVVNTKGTLLYSSWNLIFAQSGWQTKNQIWSFNGTLVDEGYGSPSWSNADGWHGSKPDGTVLTGLTCKDWTVKTSTDAAGHGEVDEGLWIGAAIRSCDNYLAVVCVQVAP